MKKIKIVYIDDSFDEAISKYMSTLYSDNAIINNVEIEKEYKETPLDCNKGYENLLCNSDVRNANIILIDNRLFEQHNAENGKFSGRQFKIILRKLFPFIEVIIVTQDEGLNGYNIIHKFSGRHGEDPIEYYNNYLRDKLDKAIEEVLNFEELAEELKKSEDVEKSLIEKVILSLEGENSYDELKKSDIDNLIEVFKELKGRV